jgi:hypothetical protein
MRLLMLAAVFAVAAGPAAATPFDGRWVWDKSICANQPGSGDVVASVYEGDTISHYESLCTITETKPIGTQESAWEIEMKCSGEGEESVLRSIFGLDRDRDGNPRQLVEIGMDDGMVIVRQRCD